MGEVSLHRVGMLGTLFAPQFDCPATIIPAAEVGALDPEKVIESCQYNDSVLEGLEGDPNQKYYCVQFEGRYPEVYTERALRASL